MNYNTAIQKINDMTPEQRNQLLAELLIRREEDEINKANESPINAYKVDDKSVVYALIDTVTFICKSMSLNEVFLWLDLDINKYINDFMKDYIKTTTGIDSVYRFNFNGLSLEIRIDEFDKLTQNHLDISNTVLDHVRIHITGTGLDWMRSIGKNVDTYLRDPSRLLPNIHCTRADFAYDFVNYRKDEKGNYLDITGILIDYVINNVGYNSFSTFNRCSIYESKAGLSCDVKTNNQRTVYIGTVNSDRYLRVYEKRLQYIDLKTGLYKSSNKYNNPDSWHRIEMQTRNKRADELFFNDCSLFDILKLIFNHYRFNDMKNTTKQNRAPYLPWLDVIDVSYLNDVKKCVDFNEFAFNETMKDKNDRYVKEIAIVPFFHFINDNGIDYTLDCMEARLCCYFDPDYTNYPELNKRRQQAFLSQLGAREYTVADFTPDKNRIFVTYDNKTLHVNRTLFNPKVERIYITTIENLFTQLPRQNHKVVYSSDGAILGSGYDERDLHKFDRNYLNASVAKIDLTDGEYLITLSADL